MTPNWKGVRSAPFAGIAIAAALLAPPARADWKAPAPVATTGEDSSWPELAASADGTLHAVWHEGPFLGDTEVLYASRPPGGPWTDPVNVSNRPNVPSSYPDVATAPDGTVHVVWDDGSFSGREIYYATLAGGAWSVPQNLSNTAGQQSFFPVVEVDGDGDVLVVWVEELGGATFAEIFFAEKPAGGSFLPPVNVSAADGDAHEPQLVVDGDALYLAWWEWDGADYDVRFAERPAGGSWTVPVELSASNEWSTDARLELGIDGTLHAVWREGPGFGAGDVAYARRPSGGSWSPFEIVAPTSGDANDPVVLALAGGTLHVAWYDWTSPQADIFAARRDPGAPWTAPVNVSGTPSTAQDFEAELRLVDGAVSLYWLGVRVVGTFGTELLAAELGPAGWSAPRSLTPRLHQGGTSPAPPLVDPSGTVQWLYASGYGDDGFTDVFHLRDDGPAPAPPLVTSFAPNGGSGQVGVATTFTTVTTDPNGGGDVQRSFLLLDADLTPAGGAFLGYDWIADRLVLFAESGSGIAGTCVPGSAQLIAHAYVELDCAASQAALAGEDGLQVSWAVTFTSCPPSGCGTLQAGALALDVDGLRGGPARVGSWTIAP